jgi:hypothetical protein
LLSPQHFGRRESGCSTADNYNFFRTSAPLCGALFAPRRGLFVAHKEFAVPLLDCPAWDGTERRRTKRLPGAQVKAGVMPGTTHRVANYESIGKRTVVMSAVRTDRESVAPATHQENLFAVNMALNQGTIGEGNTLC